MHNYATSLNLDFYRFEYNLYLRYLINIFIRTPSSLSDSTPIIFNMELTHLGLEASNLRTEMNKKQTFVMNQN